MVRGRDEGLSADRDKGSYGGSKVWYLPLTHPTVSYETLHATVYAFSLFVRSVLFLTTFLTSLIRYKLQKKTSRVSVAQSKQQRQGERLARITQRRQLKAKRN